MEIALSEIMVSDDFQHFEQRCLWVRLVDLNRCDSVVVCEVDGAIRISQQTLKCSKVFAGDFTAACEPFLEQPHICKINGEAEQLRLTTYRLERPELFRRAGREMPIYMIHQFLG